MVKKYLDIAASRYPLTFSQALVLLRGRGLLIGRGASDQTLAAHGIVLVDQTGRPEGDVVTEGQPVFNETTERYEAQWIVREYSPEEIDSQAQIEVDNKLQELQHLLDSTLSQGYEFEIEDGIDHVQLREKDVIRLNTLRACLERSEEDTQLFRGLSNHNHVMAREDVIALINDALNFELRVFTQYITLKDQIRGENGALVELPSVLTGEIE